VPEASSFPDVDEPSKGRTRLGIHARILSGGLHSGSSTRDEPRPLRGASTRLCDEPAASQGGDSRHDPQNRDRADVLLAGCDGQRELVQQLPAQRVPRSGASPAVSTAVEKGGA
jgi:hypothetical protein